MSEIDTASSVASSSQRSSPSVAELFSAAGIVTPRQAGSPQLRPHRRNVAPLVTLFIAALGIVAAINLA